MVSAGQRGSVGRVREHHGKRLRDPLTERSHQEVSAELVDAAAVVEADDAVAAGLVTAVTASAWPDLVVGLVIFALNLDAAREVYSAARDERRTAPAEP